MWWGGGGKDQDPVEEVGNFEFLLLKYLGVVVMYSCVTEYNWPAQT